MKIPESIKEVQTLFIKNKINITQTQSNLYLLRTLYIIQIINKIKALFSNKKNKNIRFRMWAWLQFLHYE